MTLQSEARPLPVTGWRWPQWLLFPSQEVAQNRRVERGLAALIWLAMPFVLYMLRSYPGGYGALITRYPQYFFLAVICVLAGLVAAFLISLLLAARAVPPDSNGYRAKRKLVLRAWMDAIVSCFALAAILLSISTWISMNWVQQGSNGVATDAVSLLLNADGLQTLPIRYGYALVAALLIGVIVRWRTAGQTPAGGTHTERLPPPNLLAVALIGYLVLSTSLLLSLNLSFWWLH